MVKVVEAAETTWDFSSPPRAGNNTIPACGDNESVKEYCCVLIYLQLKLCCNELQESKQWIWRAKSNYQIGNVVIIVNEKCKMKIQISKKYLIFIVNKMTMLLAGDVFVDVKLNEVTA